MERVAEMTIHNEIMNIPCEPIEGTESEVLSFKLGHKQARHAAAELAARLSEWQNEAAALLATFIGLSSRPDELEWSKVAIKVPALLAEEEAYEKTDLVPGVVHCARCNFRLNRVTLYMGNGAIGPGGSETEQCPNGCGPMWPVTWKQEAEDAYKTAESQFERAKAAEDQLNACRPYLKEGETAADALRRLEHSESFYRRRCEALQAWQSSMRDPERVIVCDILANGFTLDQPFAGDRYAGMMPASPTTKETT